MENDAEPANPQNNEILFKEIDLIESCITRMADNSFKCKGWAVTLVVAVLGLWCYSDFGLLEVAVISFTPILCFWIMDTKYLQMERAYRRKYEWVTENRPKGDMTGLFDLNPYKFAPNGDPKKDSVLHIMVSWSERVYPALIVAVILLLFITEVL